MMNIRTFKKEIESMKSGETFYYNAIAGTVKMSEYMKEMIQAGKIMPDAEELNKAIKPEAHYRFYRGESLAPQMTYRVM